MKAECVRCRTLLEKDQSGQYVDDRGLVRCPTGERFPPLHVVEGQLSGCKHCGQKIVSAGRGTLGVDIAGGATCPDGRAHGNIRTGRGPWVLVLTAGGVALGAVGLVLWGVVSLFTGGGGEGGGDDRGPTGKYTPAECETLRGLALSNDNPNRYDDLAQYDVHC